MLKNRLKDDIKTLPREPGIYRYFDKYGKILYIGKAKNIQKRVKSYFSFSPHFDFSKTLPQRLSKMITKCEKIDYFITANEHEALIVENSFIKQLKPKYNILLRDDKSYPYIAIDIANDFPRFEITRRVIKGLKIRYFGPYTLATREISSVLYDNYKLVQRKSCIKEGRRCMYYQIKKCLGPCENMISKEDYKKIVDDAISTLNNKQKMLKILRNKMNLLSSQLKFEDAAKIRDYINRIDKSEIIKAESYFTKTENCDVIAIKIDNTRACVLKMFIRDGQIVSSSHSILTSDVGFDLDELYKMVILEAYSIQSPLVAKKIIIAKKFQEKELVEEILSDRFKRKIQITAPLRGKKKHFIYVAMKNADASLKNNARSNQKISGVLSRAKELLKLSSTPYKIEAFDNSHLQGVFNVGASIWWENSFKKEHYRHYKLLNKNEYYQMRELLNKKILSIEKRGYMLPNLWIIDGGRALLNLALSLIEKKSYSIDIIAISKEKKDGITKRSKTKSKDLIHIKNKTLILDHNNEILLLIQKIRDEAHRFSIKLHRENKLKKDKEIKLLKISGVGDATVKKLLNYFETFKNIKNASNGEIESVIGNKKARLIIDYISK